MSALSRFIALYALMYAAFGVSSPFMPAFFQGRGLTPDQVASVMTQTARSLPTFALWEVGAGYVDALAAVNAVRR